MKFKKILKTIMASFMILGGACALTSCGVSSSGNDDKVDGPTYGIDNWRVKLSLDVVIDDLMCPYTLYITRSSAYTNPADDYYLTNLVRKEIAEKMGIEITGTKLHDYDGNEIVFDNKVSVDTFSGCIEGKFLPNYFADNVYKHFSKTVYAIWEINGDEENVIYEYNYSEKTGSGQIVNNLFKTTYCSEKNTTLENFENVNAILNSNGTLTGYISNNEQYTTKATFDNKYFENEFYAKLDNNIVFEKLFEKEFILLETKKAAVNGKFKIKTKEINGKIYTYEFITVAHEALEVTIENVSNNSVQKYIIGAR